MIDLWLCHLRHWSAAHAVLNAVAAVPPIVAMPRGRRWLFAPFLFIAAPFITLAIRANFAGEYRGASGLVVAMWIFAGLLTRHRALVAIAAAKLLVEALGLFPSHDGFVTVSIAHYAGAAAGVLGALTVKSPFLAGERARRARVRRLGRREEARISDAANLSPSSPIGH